MREYSKSGAVLALILITIAPMLVAAGCHKEGTAAGSDSGGATQTASGQAVFQSSGCGRCHALDGQGGRMGPDLSHEGADPRHTETWIAEQIRNPRAHNPSSRMPGYEGRIAEGDLKALAAYLAARK